MRKLPVQVKGQQCYKDLRTTMYTRRTITSHLVPNYSLQSFDLVLPFSFCIISTTASTPACATSASCAGVPVLQPIAPRIIPLSPTTGIPPPIVVKRLPLLFQIPNAAPPGQTASRYDAVGTRWPAAVNAYSHRQKTKSH